MQIFFLSDILRCLYFMRIFCRYSSSWFIFLTAYRTTALNGFLCHLFITFDQFNGFSGRFAYSADVSIQLGQIGKWLYRDSNTGVCPDVTKCTYFTVRLSIGNGIEKHLFLFFQNAYLYFIISVIFIIGSSLLIHMVFFAREYMWVPRHSKDTLFLSSVSMI